MRLAGFPFPVEVRKGIMLCELNLGFLRRLQSEVSFFHTRAEAVNGIEKEVFNVERILWAYHASSLQSH